MIVIASKEDESMGLFLRAFKPAMTVLPEVKTPEYQVTFREKIAWTAFALFIYLIMSNLTLYGLPESYGPDPFFWMRTILASQRGSLMELGIGPIVTAGLIMQLLAGSEMIDVDFSNPDDRALFTGVQKVMALIMTMVQSLSYIISGAFGRNIDPGVATIIFVQLVAAGFVVILLDEMLQKGWGMGSGISLFIAANVSMIIAWNSLAPIMESDNKYRGAIIAFFQTIWNGDEIKTALHRADNLPDMIGFLATVVVFLFVIYAEGMRIEIPLSYAKYRGFKGRYPIKLIYASNIPVILAAALFANVYFISQILWNNYNRDETNFWLNLLGRFEETQYGLKPTSGLVYYCTPPQGVETVTADPVRAFVYLIIFIAACAVFSVTWTEVGGMAPRDIARQLVGAGMQIPGFRRNPKIIEKVLNRYIPTVTLLGGIAIGALAAFADFMGALGTGSGVLLATMIIQQYYQMIMQERLAEVHPALRGFLGME